MRKVTLPAPWQFQAIIFIDGEWGYRESYGTTEVLKVLATGRVGHWCCAVVVLSRYRCSISPSRAQYMADTTNGRLCLEHIIMYRPTSFSCSAMFISPRSKNWKMVAGSWSEESTLEELVWTSRCLTGGTRERPTGAWYGCTVRRTRAWVLGIW